MKIRTGLSTKWLTNPLSAYAISFIAVLLCFTLGWSSLYPHLGVSLLTFITVSSVIALANAYLIKDKNRFRPIPKDPNNNKILWFILGGTMLEYIYCRTIPFFTVVINGAGGYRDFQGIPTFHVLLAGVTLFFGIYTFHQYQSNLRDKKLLWYTLLAYLPSCLNLNRGAIVIMLLSSLIIYLMRIGRISLKRIVFWLIGFFAFLFLFGVVGNMRSDVSRDDKDYILRISGATPEFIDSGIPPELYWGYIYIVSPLGNLQNILDNTSPQPSFNALLTLAITQCTPNFISKRLERFLPHTNLDFEAYLVTPVLNAPSVYYMPYLIAGWTGIILIFFFMIAVIFIYTCILNVQSVYFLTGWSSITTTIILNTFNNMWIFNGLFLIMITITASCLKSILAKHRSHRIPGTVPSRD